MTEPEPLGNAQLALFQDLARLLKKHGHEAFDSLGASLADPEFARRLSNVLSGVSAVAPRTQPRSGGRSRPADRLARARSKLEAADPEKAALLQALLDEMIGAESLPRLKDIEGFALRHGLPVSRSKSRFEALADLLNSLIAMPIAEFRRLIPELEPSLQSQNRSLEGWNQIIERSRTELG